MYGDGVYFAVNASNASTYSVPDVYGNSFMFYCSVLTGEYTIGTNNLKMPPVKDIDTQKCYDSVCDSITHPKMFVTFNDIQAYPTYLIIFRQQSSRPMHQIPWSESTSPLKPVSKNILYIYNKSRIC